MFYIDNKIPRFKRNIAMAHFGPALIVFLSFFLLTIIGYREAKHTTEKSLDLALNREINRTGMDTQAKLSTYEDILRSSVGLLGASETVTRPEWKRFVSIFDLEKRYPGIQGLGYIEMVKPSELQNHENKIRNEGLSDYKIRPAGNRSIYSSIIYDEPSIEPNTKAIGFDPLSEIKRREALFEARDTGKLAITDIVNIYSEAPPKTEKGFSMYLPVYKRGASPKTVKDRQSALIGYVFASFRSDVLFKNLDNSFNQNYGFRIYNNQLLEDNLLYQSSSYSNIDELKHETIKKTEFSVANKKWILVGSANPEIISLKERTRPAAVIWVGIIFSISMAGFIYLLLLNRTRLITQKENKELQKAKDELLALASHQLRTPATGVKQYIGLLKDGYAGKLSNEQKTYIDKAYESNERQMNIINDMLLVAKADTGNINLEPEWFNIATVLKDSISEQNINFIENDIELTSKIRKKPLEVYGDQRYIRMAIENILNNASKYTMANGKVHVSLEHNEDSVEINIEDNGIGIDKKDFPLMFLKFSRIPNSLTGKVSGSGIGLYLAKQIIEAHSGSITFDSEAGVGSNFTISFPKKILYRKL